MKDKTKVDNIIDQIKNHKIISILIVIAIMIIGINSFKDSFRSLFFISDKVPEKIEDRNHSSQINYNSYDNSKINVVNGDQINSYDSSRIEINKK